MCVVKIKNCITLLKFTLQILLEYNLDKTDLDILQFANIYNKMLIILSFPSSTSLIVTQIFQTQ